MPRRKPDWECWVRYEVSQLVSEHLAAWEAFCRQRDILQEGPLRDSPSAMHRANRERPRLETTRDLPNLALKAVGTVRFNGRLFTSADSTYSDPVTADGSVQDANGLFVEIWSPRNGNARKCK
jgi:hypothetical protein